LVLSNNSFRVLPISYHLIELKIRLFYFILSQMITFLFAYSYSEEIFYFLAKPLTTLGSSIQVEENSFAEKSFIYTNMAEVFLAYVKVSFFVSLYFSIPVAFYQFWSFLVPGLYLYEKQQLRRFSFFFFCLFTFGIFVGYYFIIPFAWKFFMGFETSLLENVLSIKFSPKVNQYLNSITFFLIVFGLCVQLPISLIYLVRIKLISSYFLAKNRSFFYLFCLLLGTILSPPDLMSQILIAIWLVFFYELSVFFSIYLKKMDRFFEV
jgi:sec-independent protein translocase protein TatC